MKKEKTIIIAVLFVISGVALFNACGPQPPVIQTGYLPKDVKKSCTIPPPDFNSWFHSGTPSENGFVNPANSVTFTHNTNCDFYKWSMQMFLWITSPSSGQYSGGNTVMETPVFYTVSPEDSAQQRVLIPHATGTKLRVMSHINQKGPNKLPLIIDKMGRMFEVETSKANEKIVVLNKEGRETEVSSIETDNKGLHLFKDKNGKAIQQPKALLKHKINRERIVREFKSGGKSLFLDSEGNIIDSEEGQATGDALMAQNGSLVYYITMVNDVYAYFLTGSKNNHMSGYQFPTTAGARDSVCAVARGNGVTLPDSNALAIELKTSWVEAVNLSNPGSYVTIDALIPTYNQSNPNQWIPNGERTAKLALIGVHVVGSMDGHPEMVWATFEHEKNSPNDSYTYIDTSNQVKIVTQDTGTGWLLNANALNKPVNISHMTVSGDTINGKNGYSISKSNTERTKPWGVAITGAPNAENPTPAASNSEIISINNDINNLLLGNDIRKNYLLIGATWTNSGAAPNGSNYNYPSDTVAGVAIGTSQLANSTMETYFQFGNTYKSYGSCFGCHNNNNGLAPGDLSHVFDAIQPLSAVLNNKKK
jgi:hypothetical protein